MISQSLSNRLKAVLLPALDVAVRQVILGLVMVGLMLANCQQAKAESGRVIGYEATLNPKLNQVCLKELNESCGPMSALIVFNFWTKGGTTDMTKTTNDLKAAILRMDSDQGLSLSQPWSEANIKSVMVDRWKWTQVKVRSKSGSAYSYSGLIADLNTGRPVIALMEGNTPFTPAGSKGTNAALRHFIVVFEANDNTVTYFDPWNGSKKTSTKKVFNDSWISTYIAVVAGP